MNEPNDGGMAFPCEQHETLDGTWNQTFDPGMSLRDWFAGMALQGLLSADIAKKANPKLPAWCEPEDGELAGVAYGVADAMIKARNKPATGAPDS